MSKRSAAFAAAIVLSAGLAACATPTPYQPNVKGQQTSGGYSEVRLESDRFRVNFERLTGQPEVHVDADLWTRFAQVILSPVRRHHQYSNMSVTVAGDRAEGLIYQVSRHWKATDGGSAEYTQIGWYENTFGCIDGEWKITRLLHTYQWVSGNGALFDFSDPELIAVMAQVFAPENRVAA